jgi:hypothetical protein
MATASHPYAWTVSFYHQSARVFLVCLAGDSRTPGIVDTTALYRDVLSATSSPAGSRARPHAAKTQKRGFSDHPPPLHHPPAIPCRCRAGRLQLETAGEGGGVDMSDRQTRPAARVACLSFPTHGIVPPRSSNLIRAATMGLQRPMSCCVSRPPLRVRVGRRR